MILLRVPKKNLGICGFIGDFFTDSTIVYESPFSHHHLGEYLLVQIQGNQLVFGDDLVKCFPISF